MTLNNCLIYVFHFVHAFLVPYFVSFVHGLWVGLHECPIVPNDQCLNHNTLWLTGVIGEFLEVRQQLSV